MTQKNKVDIPGILSRLPLFSELDATQLADIASATHERRLSRGEMLFQKGDAAKGFFVVVFGQIKLALPSAQGNEKVVDLLGAQQSFGEAVMFMDRPYPVFAEALADTMVLHISRAPVFDLIERDPLFARRLLAGLSLRLHTLVQDVESLTLRSSMQRLIGFLLQVADVPEGTGGPVEVDLPTSKHIIASRLNLTAETFSRILNELTTAKLIAVQGRHIVVHDIERLLAYGG